MSTQPSPVEASSSPRIRVAVIGGGISGLTSACALKKSNNIEINIYEATPEFSEIGAGINIWPRIWEIFANIGLDKPLAELLPRYPDSSIPELIFQARKSDQPKGFVINDLYLNGGGLRFHRADLQRTLIEQIPSNCKIHLSSRLKSYTETVDAVRLDFENGSTASCDLLVGADGIKSTVREIFLKNLDTSMFPYANPIRTVSIAYRGLIRTDVVQEKIPGHRAAKMPVMYCGKGKHLIVYPVANGQFINIVAHYTPAEGQMPSDFNKMVDVSQKELQSVFAGFELEASELLKCIDSPVRWPMQELAPLPRYAIGRTILMGDAAHAMTTHQGAGAGQAIEDAYILAALVIKAAQSGIGVSHISEVFDAICRPAGDRVVTASRTQGELCQFRTPSFDDIKEGDEISAGRLADLFETVIRAWDWVWATSIEGEKNRALDLLN